MIKPPAVPIRIEFWVQKKTQFGWDDFSCRMEQRLILDRIEELRLKYPEAKFRAIERKSKETVIEEPHAKLDF